MFSKTRDLQRPSQKAPPRRDSAANGIRSDGRSQPVLRSHRFAVWAVFSRCEPRSGRTSLNGSLMCAMIRSMSQNSEAVTVADDLLGPDIDWRTATDRCDGVEPNILVLSAEPRSAAEVLQQVTPRFYNVAEDGILRTEAEYWALRKDAVPGAEPYIPSLVSPVYLVDEGAFVFIDCDDMVFPAMLRTMIGMLVQALTETGVRAHIAPCVRVDGAMFKRATPYHGNLEGGSNAEKH